MFKFKLNLQFFAEPSAPNQTIIKGATSTTGSYGGTGLMSPTLAKKFLKEINSDASYLSRLRTETVKTKQGTIPKIGVGSRLLRSHTEGNDDISGNEVQPTIRDLEYDNKYMTLGASITEEWLEQNIEEKGFEDTFLGLIAEQERVDILDLAFNGDEDVATSDPDFAFLSMNDGFIKQLKETGNVVDNTTINGGVFNKNVFYTLLKAVDKKYVTAKFKWHVSNNTYVDLLQTLSERGTSLGDQMVLSGDNLKILGYGFEIIPNMPDDIIIFADPKNFTVTYFVKIIHKKTTEGKEAIYERKRFYATHLAADFIVQEEKAAAILINRGTAQA